MGSTTTAEHLQPDLILQRTGGQKVLLNGGLVLLPVIYIENKYLLLRDVPFFPHELRNTSTIQHFGFHSAFAIFSMGADKSRLGL